MSALRGRNRVVPLLDRPAVAVAQNIRQAVSAARLTRTPDGVSPYGNVRERNPPLKQQHLVEIPRQPKGGRRYDEFRLLSEVGSSEHPDYTVPARGAVSLPREFFTNLWVWVLSDTEIATYLMLRFVRARRPRKHQESGVFVTSGHRETLFRLHRSTWRSADILYRLRLVDKIPATGRTFRTGKVGDPKKLAENARKPVVRFKVNDEALQANALSTAWQVLTEPTKADRLRREHGPDIGDMDPLMAASLGLNDG